MSHKAFLTGSHVYGTPTAESDVDLVIRADDVTITVLTALLGTTAGDPDAAKKEYEDTGSISVRAGKLNLLLCSSDARFESWREGTATLAGLGFKVTRDQAVAHFKKLRAAERRKP